MIKIGLQNILNKYIKKNYFGKEITAEDFQPILKEIRLALLNSDVALPVVQEFLNNVKEEVINNKSYGLNKDELEVQLFAVIKEKLIQILKPKTTDLNLKNHGCSKILFIGMNGSGKTTSIAKLGNFLKKKKNKKVKHVSLDIYRPAGFEQLRKLSESVQINCFHTIEKDFEKTISHYSQESLKDGTDVLIFDTAGLIPHSEEQLEELKRIKDAIDPVEVIFVLDALAGQDAINIIKFFHDALKVTSLFITKTDSNAPMGASFSINYLLNIPIKFMGSGEKMDDLMPFAVERIVGKILGEGDVIGLAEKLGENISEDTAKKSIKKMMSGKFDLLDLINQVKEIKKLGSVNSILKFLPNMNVDTNSFSHLDNDFIVWEVLVQSMTKKEKRDPRLFKKQPSRKVRVIKGSGRKPDELNKLLKKWEESKKRIEEISKRFGKRGMQGLNMFG